MPDYILVNKELYHHGIKGQKWGVRRFQKKDGSLTPAGKKRYSDSDGVSDKPKKVSTHRVVLEKKYMDKGMTAEEAKLAANKRIKTEKYIAAAAAVTVAACAAYYAKNKYSETYCDQVLKAGTSFHNLDRTANNRPDQHLYVAYRQNDVNYFRGKFALIKMKNKDNPNHELFDHVVTAKEDIKIPSINTRKNVFRELYNNDEQFRKTFNDHSHILDAATRKDIGLKPKDHKISSADKVYKKMWRKFGDKDNPEFNVAKRKYFDALRQKGYDAIVDEWDTRKDVYRSDAPLILLNTSSKRFGEMKINELDGRDVLIGQANSRNYERGRMYLNWLYAPHTNHFNESSKLLSRQAAKSARNTKYVDEYLKRAGESFDPKKAAMKLKGAEIADAGKYASKYKNMSFEQAKNLAKAKRSVINSVESTVGLGVAMAPYIVAQRASNNRYVMKYLEEHPNTELTYNEIVLMKKNGR